MKERKFKMTITISVILIVLAILGGCSAKPPVGPAQPEINHLEFNWGRIPQNGIVTHVYELKNAGGDSIIIEELRPHCGCTTAPLKTEIVKAGLTAPLELRYNSAGARGKSRKSAMLRYKVGAESTTKQLFFDAFVDTMNPPFADGQIGVNIPIIEFDESTETIEIELTNRIAAGRELVIVDTQDDRIELSWRKKSLGPKESAKLKIKRKIPADKLYASITMEMIGYDNTRITLPVGGKNRQPERSPGVRQITPPRPAPKEPNNNPWLEDPNYRGKPR